MSQGMGAMTGTWGAGDAVDVSRSVARGRTCGYRYRHRPCTATCNEMQMQMQIGMQIQIRHSTAQYKTAQHDVAQRSAAQRSAAQRSAAQHGTAQHNTTQHNTTQQCIRCTCNLDLQHFSATAFPSPSRLGGKAFWRQFDFFLGTGGSTLSIFRTAKTGS